MIAPSIVTPLEFIEGELECDLYPWQVQALMPLSMAGYGLPLVQVSVLTPNESGKSNRVVAGGALYLLSLGWRIGITTKDSKQLNEQIIPAIEAHVSKFGWHSVKSPYCKVTTQLGGVLIAFCTDDANRVEGLHGSPEHPVAWFVDEAKSVDEPIFSGIDRCGYQALIYTSTGGLKKGSFYESQYGKTSADFIKVRASLKDCPHISPEKVDRIIKKYGIDNPFTRSSVFGEFMEQSDEDEYCLGLTALLNCLNNPPRHRPGLKKFGRCDFGAGKAEHVLAVRDGNKIEIAAAWVESNKDATAGRFIREFVKAGFTASKAGEQLECDASDKEIWQKLANAGWVLKRVNAGAPPRLKSEYLSKGAEEWLEMAIQVGLCQWILPDDDIAKAQAVDRKKGYTGAGKLCVEDKLSMAERGVVSPDRWDAICGVASIAEPIVSKDPFVSYSEWKAQEERSERRGVMASMGARSGF